MPAIVIEALRGAVEVVCLHIPERFTAIGQRYAEFTQTRDEEVVALLNRAARAYGRGEAAGPT